MTTPYAADLPFEEQRAGQLGVRLALSAEEIDAAQALRYRVFHEEMGAKTKGPGSDRKRDIDPYDDVCDHLLVLDYDQKPGSQVVGNYRLLRREAMKKVGHFYTEGEFQIDSIKNYPGEILELGRSCVDMKYRNRVVMQLLWRGIAMYVDHHNISIMFGCGSFTGTNPQEHAEALSYLHHYHGQERDLQPVALPKYYVEMNMMPKEKVNVKRSFAELPTLIKGYLRLGGYIGRGAVVDQDYNTTDVGIVVETKLVTDKYLQRYAPNLLQS